MIDTVAAVIVNEARSAELAIIISYPTKASGIIQWSLFLGHGIMAHIPWPLSQSNSWNFIIMIQFLMKILFTVII